MKYIFWVGFGTALLGSCKKEDTGTTGNYSFKGTLSQLSTSSFLLEKHNGNRIAINKTVTHVMAISPQTANPERFITEVNSDGQFNLGVTAGKPYVLVFIAASQNLTGPDMIASIVKISANDLDTLAPTQPGSAELGTVTLNGSTLNATISTSVSELLAALGISASEATFIGSIDDLSLRAANPDVDGNGIIDKLENKNFNMDWHLRANTKVGGNQAKFSDAVNTFLNQPTLEFTLNSGYAVYPSSFYNGICPLNSGVNTTLISGCSFDIRSLAGSSVIGSWPHSSASGGGFGDNFQWGPDFYPTSSQEMPGSNGTGVRMVYGFPNGQTLTFWNVKTRTIASLTANGTVLPFVRLNTSDNTSNGTMTNIQYKWMRLEGGVWVDATANEVALIANSDGAHVMFYTRKSAGVEEGFSFQIPSTSPSGTLTWNASNINATGSVALTAATPNSFCSSAVSYDDKIGLRIFAGGFEANTGVTPCP